MNFTNLDPHRYNFLVETPASNDVRRSYEEEAEAVKNQICGRRLCHNRQVRDPLRIHLGSQTPTLSLSQEQLKDLKHPLSEIQPTADTFVTNLGYFRHLQLTYVTGKCSISQMWLKAHKKRPHLGYLMLAWGTCGPGVAELRVAAQRRCGFRPYRVDVTHIFPPTHQSRSNVG